MSQSVVKKLKFDDMSNTSTGSTPKTHYGRYKKDDKIYPSEVSNRGVDVIKKKILFSGKRRSHYCDDVSCIEIYQQITDKIQENMKNNSDTRTSFMSAAVSILRSLEEFLEANSATGEDKYAELLDLMRARNALQNKLDKKLTLVEEHVSKFLQSIQYNEEDRMKDQKIAIEKFDESIEKYKKSLPAIINKEREAKMKAFKHTLSFFAD